MIKQHSSTHFGKCRVVFHAINGIGLGHLSRLIAIALAIREIVPQTDIFFVVEGDSHGLLQSARIPYMTIPTFKHSDSWALWPTSKRERLGLSVANSVIQVMNPDLIVFDCFPNKGFLTAARQNKIPFTICVRKMREMDGFFGSLIKDIPDIPMILVPHNPGEIIVPEELREKTHFVGYIARPFSPRQAELGDTLSAARVVITGGGGGFPNTVNFYNTALAAFACCRLKEPSLTGLLVTGPLFQDWHRLKPVEGVEIIPFSSHLTAAFAAADLVICQAGYNTIAELTSLSAPAICIPAQREFDDQYDRAKSVGTAYPNIHMCIDPDPDSLAARMLQVLNTPRVRARNDTALPPLGAFLAAKLLIDKFTGRQQKKVTI